MMKHDIVVIGGGPAGMAAAVAAYDAGVRDVVIIGCSGVTSVACVSVELA